MKTNTQSYQKLTKINFIKSLIEKYEDKFEIENNKMIASNQGLISLIIKNIQSLKLKLETLENQSNTTLEDKVIAIKHLSHNDDKKSFVVLDRISITKEQSILFGLTEKQARTIRNHLSMRNIQACSCGSAIYICKSKSNYQEVLNQIDRFVKVA